MQKSIEIPTCFEGLFKPARYKVYYGGRGGSKSWSIAQALVLMAYTSPEPLRILCAREYQTSIADSVMALLVDTIHRLNLERFFYITKTKIIAHNGSEFIFKGLRLNPHEIKSTENVKIVWVEEGASVSRESWEILRPTIRAEGSEIWVSFNPKDSKDPVYADFVAHVPRNAISQKVLYSDNPWFPKTLDEERRIMEERDPEAYRNIWLGETRYLSNAVIFKGKFEVMCFETPEDVQFFHGLDFGFADDPNAGTRSFILDDCLYIDRESWGLRVELDNMRDWLVDAIPTFASYPIYADSARPETISKLRRTAMRRDDLTGNIITSPGLNVRSCKKWKGSVLDGIQILRGFKRIYIHEKNCPRTAEEFELYKFKVDRVSEEILPIPEDRYDHAIDSLRYALEPYILAKMSPSDIQRAYGSTIIAPDARQRKARGGGIWVQ